MVTLAYLAKNLGGPITQVSHFINCQTEQWFKKMRTMHYDNFHNEKRMTVALK